jgi:hypothetical protein
MSIESEHADMAERLRAIAQIVNGGVIPAAYAAPKASTSGCNCPADGNPNRNLHAFGCPFGGPGLREAPARAL